MINIYLKLHHLMLVSLVVLLGLFSACNPDEESSSSIVELSNFGPVGSQHGDTLQFFGANMDKVNEVNFVGATVLQSDFVKQTNELILIKIPQSAESGLVTLKTEDQEIVSKTRIDFEVTVSITSISESVRPEGSLVVKGQYVNWIREVWFSKDLVVRDSDFVSASLTEVVIPVPKNAQTGTLVINTGGTEPLSIEFDLNVVLPSIASFAPNPVDLNANLTITGTDLDLVKSIILKGVSAPVTEFVSQSATEIVVTVPEGTTKGFLTLVAFSDVQVVSAEKLLIVGDLPDLAPLAYAFYTDALQNGWSEWGWGTTKDLANTANVRDGEYAIKETFSGGWGALRFGGGNVSTSGYSEVTFAIYGDAGTDGQKIKLSVNWGTQYDVIIQEGKWVEFKVPLSDLGNPADIGDLVFQEAGFTGDVYFDHIGLR